MLWSALAHIFSLLLELLRIGRLSDQEKDIEILVLRYQLGIADRKLGRTTCLAHPVNANRSSFDSGSRNIAPADRL